MHSNNRAGWCYVLTHPLWDRVSIVKIGMTSRDPLRRAAEITSVSGLIAPCQVAWCCWVEDRAAVERAVKQMLIAKRVSGRRELFRTDVVTAKAAIEQASCFKAPVSVPMKRVYYMRPRPVYRRTYRRRRRWSFYACAATVAAVTLLLAFSG